MAHEARSSYVRARMHDTVSTKYMAKLITYSNNENVGDPTCPQFITLNAYPPNLFFVVGPAHRSS